MRKFYIYLIISLLAISYPYDSCKGLPQQRNRLIFSTKKKQKRNDGLATQIVAGVCVMIILYFSWDHSLRVKKAKKDKKDKEIQIEHLNNEIERFIKKQKQAKKEMEKIGEQIDLIKWNVKPERKKFSEEELRKEWLKAARNLDFYTMEWLQVG